MKKATKKKMARRSGKGGALHSLGRGIKKFATHPKTKAALADAHDSFRSAHNWAGVFTGDSSSKSRMLAGAGAAAKTLGHHAAAALREGKGKKLSKREVMKLAKRKKSAPLARKGRKIVSRSTKRSAKMAAVKKGGGRFDGFKKRFGFGK